MHGKDGLTLTAKWKDGLATLHGMHTRGFPTASSFPMRSPASPPTSRT
uniref:Uncharacterized protein n=1 Tax=Phenylobacterium glaciei TaxID=2803784 RepID=A0A974P1M4_9CAUL|nr:hypothetical protein JKL49_19555 [Phenylobacterium glaciei]